MSRTLASAAVRGAALAVALVAALTPSAASAQDGLAVDNLFLSATRDPGAPIGPAPADLQRPLAGGRRYAVTDTAVVDLRHPSGGFPLPAGAVLLAVDPARPRLFLAVNCDRDLDRCDVVAWHFLTGATLPLTTMAFTVSGGFFITTDPMARYAVDADLLFVDRASNWQPLRPRGPRSIVPVNASTGEVVRSGIATRLAAWDVLPDGSRLIVGADSLWTSDDPPPLEVVDVASGQVVSRGGGVVEKLVWEASLHAIIGVDPSMAGVVAYDLALRPLGAVRVDWGCSVGWQASPHTGRVYILSGGGWNYIGRYPTHLFVLEPGVGLLDVDLSIKAGIPSGDCSTLRVLSAPGAPRSLRAVVAGRDVTLRWENVGAASHFVLDVGLAPGRTDLSVYLGPDSHAAFSGVPSGTYYLRLRGGNEFGGGRPSQEIRMVVP